MASRILALAAAALGVASCSLLLTGREDAAPADSDADLEARDGEADEDLEARDGEADEDLEARDGEVDEPIPLCPRPTGLDRARFEGAGCPWIDREDLVELRTLPRSDDQADCVLETTACTLTCLSGQPPVPSCTVSIDSYGPICVLVVERLEVGELFNIAGSARAAIFSRREIVIADALRADGGNPRGGPGGGRGGDRGRIGEGSSPGQGGREALDGSFGGGGGGALRGAGGPGGCSAGGQGGAGRTLWPEGCEGLALLGGSGGGGAADAESGARGGGGGGALWLFSTVSIEITPAGRIDVSGGSGNGAVNAPELVGGGGGGGSGGTVVLEAPVVANYNLLQIMGGFGGHGRDHGVLAGVRGEGGGTASAATDGTAGTCVSGSGGGGGGGAGAVVVRTLPGGFTDLGDDPSTQGAEATCVTVMSLTPCAP